MKTADDLIKSTLDKNADIEQLIHFGELIKKRLFMQGRSIRWFALQMNCDRSNMYKMLARAHVDTNFILRACRILNHDFFKEVSRILQKAEL